MDVLHPSNELYPDVFVGKLSDEVRKALADGKTVQAVTLGDAKNTFEVKFQEAVLNELIGDLMKLSKDAYFLSWTGNKIPRGADVGGFKIGWTQNGQVLSEDGEMIGVYDRTQEWGGESGKEQQMFIFLTAPKKS